jgi:anti-sigma factor RsiW
MRDEHIMSIIESAPLKDLSESDRARIRAHTASCPECLRAFEAAQISALLLRERAAVEVEPSPFFQTRVLAALRERQAANESFSFKRLWKATGALVSSMAATVAALVVLTIFAPGSQPTVGPQQQQAYSSNAYSAEQVIFDRAELPEEQMSYEQVLATLYGADEER